MVLGPNHHRNTLRYTGWFCSSLQHHNMCVISDLWVSFQSTFIKLQDCLFTPLQHCKNQAHPFSKGCRKSCPCICYFQVGQLWCLTISLSIYVFKDSTVYPECSGMCTHKNWNKRSYIFFYLPVYTCSLSKPKQNLKCFSLLKMHLIVHVKDLTVP